MPNAMNFRNGPRPLASILVVGLLAALPLLHMGCTQKAQDKADSQVPAISGLTFEDLATPTTAWVAKGGAPAWTMTANAGTTYLMANYAATGGSAVLSPGNLPMLSGVPVNLTPSATTTYTLTVTDAAGHVASQSSTLTVVPPPNATITAPTAAIANTTGLAASVPSDVSVNAPGTTFQWTSLSNCVITSDASKPAITFTAGSANIDGSAQNLQLQCKVTNPANTPVVATQTATVQVNATPPANLSYPAKTLTFYQGLAIQKQSPTVTGAVQSYTVTPALPAGLLLDPLLGTLTGTPTALTSATNYTVTAANSGGSTTAVLNISVQGQPAIVFNPPSPAKIGPGDTSILSWTSGSNVSAISIVGNPADATLPATFSITGSANVSPAQTTVYTLTATLVGGGTLSGGTQTVTLDKTPLAFTTQLSAGAGVVAYGGSTTLNWVLAGTPDVFTLTSPATTGSVSLLGKTSYTLTPLRRQSYTLTASNKVPSSATSGPVMVAAQGLDTLAGNVTLGGGSHDGAGTAAQFNGPYNIARDPAGNIYVPDANNHIIRVVTPQGAVSTLAGICGVPGVTDGVSGLQAQFRGPHGVAYWVDPSTSQAYLFVVEYSNNCVRKITLNTSTTPPTATNVSLFAGVMGTTTYGTSGNAFDSPSGIIIDSSNNMYVSEQYYGDVLKITGLSGAQGNTYLQNGGALTVYAGNRGNDGYVDGPNASAYFYQISSMVMDSSNNIYVAESKANRIRMITPTTTSTLAGDTAQLGLVYNSSTKPVIQGAAGFVDGKVGTSRLNSPGGLALSGSTLYVADTSNNAVRALNLSTGSLTTVIGSPTTGSATPGAAGSLNGQGTAATLASPQGLLLDASGNLYISELGNNDIRKADTSLNVTNFVGSAAQVGSTDGALGTGSMAINPALSANKTMAGMVQDSAGNLYVADVYNNAIRMISPAGVLSTIAGTAGLSTAGSLDGTGAAASFNQPNGLAIDGSGNLYVVDTNNSTIRVVAWDSTNKVWNVSTIAGKAGVTGAADGALGTSTFKFPYGITFNAKDGCLYVTDSGNGKIRKLVNTAGSWTVSTLAPTVVTLSTPMGIAADAAGNLYFSDRGKYYVGMLTAPTWVGSVIGGLSGTYGYANGAVGATKTTSSLFNYPQGVSVDGSGAVWVADLGNNTVEKIANVAGVWTTTTVVGQCALTNSPPLQPVPAGTSVGPFPATLFMPQSVLVSPSGHDLFITTNGGVAQATSIDGQ